MPLPDSLQRAISQRFGLRPRANWGSELESAIAELAKQRQVAPQLLESCVCADSDLLRTIAGRLTIEETFFFRFPRQIAVAVEHLCKRQGKGPSSTSTLWSAGCSSGEEPHSVAIALHDRLGTSGQQLSIVACDINIAAVARAREGIYGSWSFRGVPDGLKARCFERVDAERYRLRPVYRGAVRIEHLGIEEMAQQLGKGMVNVVLFRNVGVYLEEAALRRCFDIFHRVLGQGDLLIQAATDPSPPSEQFTRVTDSAVGVYEHAAVSEPSQQGESVDGSRKRVDAQAWPRTASLRPSRPVEALAMGDRGELLQAIQSAKRSIDLNPSDSAAFFIRAQLLLADEQPDAAVEDLRRVLFLRPSDRVARYWYIVALQAAGKTGRVIAQISELRRQLCGARDDEPLEDGSTLARELREALVSLEGLYA